MVGNIMSTKEYSKEDFNKNDPIARESIKRNIHIPDCRIVDNIYKNPYEIDMKIIACLNHTTIYAYIEGEMKNEKSWIKEFPFETVSFLTKRLKYYKKGIPSYYIMPNKDCSTAVMMPIEELLKLSKCYSYRTDCKFTNNELKIYVPKQYCIFGWKNIETDIIEDIFPLMYPSSTSLLDILSRSIH